jgi:heme-degrading monooxygenase HmoA
MRVWKGRVAAHRSSEYLDHMRATGLKDYAQTPGNLATYAAHRRQGDVAEFMMVTLWESWEAIHRFTGPDHEKAQYYPRDPEFLLEMDAGVVHFELDFASGGVLPSSTPHVADPETSSTE